jgi:hypothetical protein
MENEPKLDKCLDSIHRMELVLMRIQQDIEINTDDLTEHIRRTELLEKKLSKVYTAALVMAGFISAKLGPEILKLLGVTL